MVKCLAHKGISVKPRYRSHTLLLLTPELGSGELDRSATTRHILWVSTLVAMEVEHVHRCFECNWQLSRKNKTHHVMLSQPIKMQNLCNGCHLPISFLPTWGTVPLLILNGFYNTVYLSSWLSLIFNNSYFIQYVHVYTLDVLAE